MSNNLYYKIKFNSPRVGKKLSYQKIILVRRTSPMETEFNTIEDIKYIEAYTIYINNVLGSAKVIEHLGQPLEVFGKMCQITGITKSEFMETRAGCKFLISTMKGMWKNLVYQG